ncbi:hypothetical protein [Burkholderia vietnamiensis]|uniref:hypothetical protein n=1 Tax=Burkholderia vietnamiensis TaxID=60552 RepID=UPI001CF19232|nr:hypothetical protein [Burkholderia vietnamiensis]MCA8291869.1 hypothetical protein [Burkholderia vietnamiensis]
MDELNDCDFHSSDVTDLDNPDWILAHFFSREAEWRAQFVGGNRKWTNSARKADEILLILRKMLESILNSEFALPETQLYLMAYDSGVAEGLCGSDSAVCVGVRKGLSDALHVTLIEISRSLVNKAEILGKRHGMLIRGLIQGDALLAVEQTSFVTDRVRH